MQATTVAPEADVTIAIQHLTPSPLNPRKQFDGESFDTLTESISRHGIIEPIVVREASADAGAPFEIIAGERRYRAAKAAGITSVPIRNLGTVSDDTALQLMLVENLQRADLNPIEEAAAYQALNDAGRTHQQIAALVGRSQSMVGNGVRLLHLPQDVQDAVADGRLSAGHGVALCRWNQWPHIVTYIAKRVLEYELPVARIAKLDCMASHPILPTGERNPEMPYVYIRRMDFIAPSAFGKDWIPNPDLIERDDVSINDPYGSARFDILGWATNAKDACEMIAEVAADRAQVDAEAVAVVNSPEAAAERERKDAEKQAKAESKRQQERAEKAEWLGGVTESVLLTTADNGLTQRQLAVIAGRLFSGIWDGAARDAIRAMLPESVTDAAPGEWWTDMYGGDGVDERIATLATADVTTLHDVIAVALLVLHGDDTKAKAGSPAAANIATARAWLLGEDVDVAVAE